MPSDIIDNNDNDDGSHFRLPRPPSNLITVDTSRATGTKKVPTRPEQPDYEARREIFQTFKRLAEHECPLEGANCTKTNPLSVAVGHDDQHRNSQIVDYEENVRLRMAISNFSVIQQKHLLEHHKPFVIKRRRELDERANHVQALERAFNAMATLPKKIKALEQMGGENNHPKGAVTWRIEMRALTNELRATEDIWYDLLAKEQNNPALKEVGDKVREELDEKHKRIQKAEAAREALKAKGFEV